MSEETPIRCDSCGGYVSLVPSEHPRSRYEEEVLMCLRDNCSDHVLGWDAPIDLDLFCGVGGVGRSLPAYGYHQLADVVGIDADGSKADTYPGYFIEHDLTRGLPEVLEVLPSGFDIAWASPPCTFATGLQFRRSGENLIDLARSLLKQVDAEITVIENVPGARNHLRNPVQFCGSAFDLGVQKHRVFETSFPARSTTCDHPNDGFPFCIGEREHPVEEYREAHGFPRDAPIGAKQVRECIPPSYVHELINQYMESCGQRGVAVARQTTLREVVAR